MGIKNFSKAFNATRTIKPKDMRDKSIAIDAMTEIYRAALGAKQTNVLTDASGNPTLHISVVLSNILNFRKNNVTQIWVFDHDQDPNSDFHNPMKIGELAKRKKRKETALDKIKSLKDVTDDSPMFSDDEDESSIKSTHDKLPPKDPEEDIPIPEEYEVSAEEEAMMDTWPARKRSAYILAKTMEAKQRITEYLEKKKAITKIYSLEKQAFTLPKEMIHDIKLILNFLKIKYIEAPQGFEGEAVASYLNEIGQVDAVYSSDTDPIAYGAKVLWRRNPKDKEIYEYTIEDILAQISASNEDIPEPTIDDFLRAAAALGTDACEKTPGIGAKTVLKKLDSIKLNAAQKKALEEFCKRPEPDQLLYYNDSTTPFENCDVEGLINWLVNERSFNRTRITVQIQKAINDKLEKVTKSTKLATKKVKASKTSSKPLMQVIHRKGRTKNEND